MKKLKIDLEMEISEDLYTLEIFSADLLTFLRRNVKVPVAGRPAYIGTISVSETVVTSRTMAVNLNGFVSEGETRWSVTEGGKLIKSTISN